MPRSIDYRRGYAAGYSAGAKWPDYMPPKPPDHLTRKMMDSGRNLRNCVDSILAVLDGEDDWQSRYGPAIDQWDECMAEIGRFIKDSALDESRAQIGAQA
jgi:hypothetical protein